ncbi:MAG: hypothetical protein ACR2O7_11965 [Parasphingorhabdus sp.]
MVEAEPSKISNEFETDCAFNEIAERKLYKQVQTELRYRLHADSIHPYCYVADNLGGFLSGKAARSASARSDNAGKFRVGKVMPFKNVNPAEGKAGAEKHCNATEQSSPQQVFPSFLSDFALLIPISTQSIMTEAPLLPWLARE